MQSQEFNDAVDELKALHSSLTSDERVALDKVEIFDFDDWKKKWPKDLLLEDMIKTVRKLIDSTKEDREKYHRRKKLFEAGLTGTHLLARYRNLSDEWKIYARTRLSVKLKFRYSDDLTNKSLFEMFARIDANDDYKNDSRDVQLYRDFSTILTEIEIVQPFDLQASAQVAPVVTETKEVDPEVETRLYKILFDDHVRLFAQEGITKDELLLAMKQVRAIKVLENYKVGRLPFYKILISTKDGTYMTRLMWLQYDDRLLYQAETDQTVRDTLLKTFLLDMILSQHLVE